MTRLVLTTILLILTAKAQTSGHVADPQGHPVPHATIQAFKQSDTYRTETNLQGDFTLVLPPGDFILEVEAPQFRRQTLNTPKSPIKIDLELEGVNQTITITANAQPQIEQETSKAITTIGREEIEARNATTLADIVRFSPGIQVRSTGGLGQLTTFRTRGLRADASAVLIDGLRFRDATTLQSDASSFISSLNFINADRVEVLRGSASSLYGTNAVGGAVNVVTPQGGGPTHGDLQIEGGNLGLFRTRAAASGGLLNDKLKYSTGILHINQLTGIDGNDRARSTGGQGFLRYALTQRISLSARLLASDDFAQTNVSPTSTGTPPATGIIEAVPNATFIPGRDDPDSRRASRFASAAFVFRDDINARLTWQASYQRTHTNRTYDDGPLGPSFQPAADNHSRYLGDIDTADIHATAQPTQKITLIAGYEFEREAYADLQNNNLPGTRLVFEQTHVNQTSHAGYFAAQFSLLNRRLQISISGRLQAFELARPRFDITGAANNYNTVPLNAPPAAFTGDVSAAYLTSTQTKLRGHFGNAYRAPSLYERFGGGFSTNPATGLVGFTAYGDPRLASDRYNSLDGGIDQYLFNNKAKVSATYFYTRIIHQTAFDFSGIVNAATDPFGRAYGYINGSGGISRGAELAVETRPLRSLTINASYSYVNADTDKDISVPRFYKLFSLQPHTVTLVATKTWAHRLDITVDMFHGSAYYVPFFAVTSTRVYNFPGFTTTGLTASYKLWQGEKRSIRTYARISNLFNETYYESGWLAAKATFALGLRYAF